VLYGDVSMALLAPDVEPLRAHRPVLRPVPGFVAGSWLVVATVRGQQVGCARVEPTPVPFPGERAAVVREMGLGRCDEWLAGGMELTELVVASEARGCGIGSLLLSVVPSLATDGRAWLELRGPERVAQPFFGRRDWAPASDGSAGVVVLLPAAHPAARAGHVDVPPSAGGCGSSPAVRRRGGGADV
jgi:GNAT superfamily N-acetyltransferase